MEFYRGKENKDQKRSSSDPGRKFAVRATYKNLFVHDGWLYFGSGQKSPSRRGPDQIRKGRK